MYSNSPSNSNKNNFHVPDSHSPGAVERTPPYASSSSHRSSLKRNDTTNNNNNINDDDDDDAVFATSDSPVYDHHHSASSKPKNRHARIDPGIVSPSTSGGKKNPAGEARHHRNYALGTEQGSPYIKRASGEKRNSLVAAANTTTSEDSFQVENLKTPPHSDRGDDADLSDAGSDTSVNTKDSAAKVVKKISNRPILLYMILCVLVPVAFLIGYQANASAQALYTRDFIQSRIDAVNIAFGISRDSQLLMLVGSALIGARNAYGIFGTQLPHWAPAQMLILNGVYRQTQTAMSARVKQLLLMVAEGSEQMSDYLDFAVQLPAHLTNAEAAQQSGQLETYQSEIYYVMDAMTQLFAYLRHHDEMKPLGADLIEMQLGMTQIASFATAYATVRAVVVEFNTSLPLLMSTSTYKTARCAGVASYWAESERLRKLLISSTEHSALRTFFKTFLQQVVPNINTFIQPFINCKFIATMDFSGMLPINASTPLTRLDGEYIAARESIDRDVVRVLLHSISENEDVAETAMVEGIKLLAAIVCSIIGLIIVVVMQSREREELFSIIDHSARLQLAVRRFVPKNQLRVMGIRTVLEAEPGYSMEVSQSLLFSDIRSFTTLSEKKSRQELFDWLQMYVARMTGAVQAEKGYVDKFIGDAVFAVYPAAPNAVASAMLMQKEADMMNLELVSNKSRDLLRIGVGVHHGIVMAGVFGDENRRSCTLIAPDVNLASRLESMSKPMGARIILSRAVMDQILVDNYEIRSLGGILAAGSGKKLEIFDLFQTDPDALKNFKSDTKDTWEKAVELCDSTSLQERSEATKLFDELQQEADKRRVEDVGLNFKKLVARRTSSGAVVQLTKEKMEQLDEGEEVTFN